MHSSQDGRDLVVDRGSLCVKLPLPPSCFSTLYNNDEGFIEEYLAANPGYYTTGDAGVIDSNGYVSVLVSAAAPVAPSEAPSKLAAAQERMDDVINVAAHRLSTGNIEAVVKAQLGVSDAAVVGAADDFKGQVPIACVVLNDAGTGREEELRAEINSAVRTEVSPVAALAGICAPHCCLDCVCRLLG